MKRRLLVVGSVKPKDMNGGTIIQFLYLFKNILRRIRRHNSVKSADLKREISRELYLKTIGGPFQTCACSLVVDYKQIAIRFVDVTQTNVNG